VRQSKTVGVLYLENELVAGVFTSERLVVLELLASQAAISLENAFLINRESQLRAMAEKTVQLREDFISIAAHELRTPLTAQKMQLRLLQSLITDELAQKIPKAYQVLKLVKSSDQQLERLSQLVEDLLDSSRMSSGKLTLNFEYLDLSELVSGVVERYRLDLEKANCRLEFQAQKGVLGNWDRFRLEQVVVNLLSNAIKYGAGKPIHLETSSENNHAKILVQDHGIGIPEEDQGRIFERFQRAVSVNFYGGFGLGLYISRKIVEAHGGTFQVQSKLGEGAQFIIQLPRFLQ
jgi:signal transduction histidine kinase